MAIDPVLPKADNVEHGEDDGVQEEEVDPYKDMDLDSPSYRCLKEIEISDSKLALEPYYFFPELEDPGIDEALTYEESEPVEDDIGVGRYVRYCKMLAIVPMTRIVNNLDKQVLDLKYYGLTYKQSRALFDTLLINNYITELILEDTWLCVESVELLSQVLSANNKITKLNLRECRIGPEGAEKLAEGLSNNLVLQELDLSHNGIEDSGLLALKDPIRDNYTIKILNLSHNELTSDKSGQALKEICQFNSYIEQLDLGWNKLNEDIGNRKIGTGIRNNETITKFWLSWNGISQPDALTPFMKFFRSPNLVYLDLSWNRIAGECIKPLKIILMGVKSLVELNLSGNPMSPDHAYEIAKIMLLKPPDILRKIDMSCIAFTTEIKPLLEKIVAAEKTLIIGDILSNFTIKGPNVPKVYFERCRFLTDKPKKKKLKKDFGHVILTLPDKINGARQDLDDAVNKTKAKNLDEELMNDLCELFTNKRKELSFVRMKNEYLKIWPDTVLPPPKPKKEKKPKKKGKSSHSVQTIHKKVSVTPLKAAPVSSTTQAQEPIGDADVPAEAALIDGTISDGTPTEAAPSEEAAEKKESATDVTVSAGEEVDKAASAGDVAAPVAAEDSAAKEDANFEETPTTIAEGDAEEMITTESENSPQARETHIPEDMNDSVEHRRKSVTFN